MRFHPPWVGDGQGDGREMTMTMTITMTPTTLPLRTQVTRSRLLPSNSTEQTNQPVAICVLGADRGACTQCGSPGCLDALR